jgi:hypothetical protein
LKKRGASSVNHLGSITHTCHARRPRTVRVRAVEAALEKGLVPKWSIFLRRTNAVHNYAPSSGHTHLTHVLLGGEDELVIDDPVRLPLEQRGGRMDVHGLVFHQALVALLRVLTRRVEEEARSYGAPDAVEVLARAHAVQPEAQPPRNPEVSDTFPARFYSGMANKSQGPP